MPTPPPLSPRHSRPSRSLRRPRRGVPAPVAALLAAALLLAPPAAAQEAPCSGEAWRAFDFWIGTWEVTTPDGSVAGTNTIEPVMGGCVLHESYSNPRGYHGESFNTWDPGRGVWHQTWVDNGGTLLLLDGGLRDGSMVMEGTTRAADGSETLQRIRWSVVDGDPDRVRQLWEASSDGGESWTVVFDGLYTRKE